MTRTKLVDRVLPTYTKGEEIANMVTHIIGAILRNSSYCFMCNCGSKQS